MELLVLGAGGLGFTWSSFGLGWLVSCGAAARGAVAVLCCLCAVDGSLLILRRGSNALRGSLARRLSPAGFPVLHHEPRLRLRANCWYRHVIHGGNMYTEKISGSIGLWIHVGPS